MKFFASLIYLLAASATFLGSFVYSTGWFFEKQVAQRKLAEMDVPLSQASIIGAIAKNDSGQLELLQTAGVSLDIPDELGNTPLFKAIRHDSRSESTKILIRLTKDINHQNEEGFTSLSLALQQKNIDLAKSLLKRGADANCWIQPGIPALVAASENADEPMIDLLLSNGANASITDSSGQTPLGQSIIKGHIGASKLLLAAGASPDSRAREDGETVLLYLCSLPNGAGCHVDLDSRLELVDALLSRGADPDIANKSKRRPIQLAIENKLPAISRLLFDKCQDYSDCLWLAIDNGDEDIFKSLVEKGEKLGQRDPGGQTPLSRMINEGRSGLVSFLLDRGADPDEPGKEGQRPLSLAIARGNADVASALLNHSQPAIPDYELDSPASQEFLELIDDSYLKTYLTKDRGVTPLMAAAALQHPEIVKMLLDKGVKRNVFTKKFKTYPINFACHNKNVDIQQLILGADPTLDPQPRKIVVSLSKQRATFYKNGEAFTSTPLSSGKRGYRTRTGEFTISNKYRSWTSTIYTGASMPFFMRLSCSDFGFHSGSLPGYPASHGCIRLPYSKAKSLFSLAKVGDRVVITD